MALYGGTERPLGDVVVQRLKNLLGVFVAAVMYFVLVYHLTNLYATEHHGVEAFVLLGHNGGGVYAKLFWGLQIFLGSVVPLLLFWYPAWSKSRAAIATGSALVILGGLAQMYIIIIGGQAFPLQMFPGKEVSSSFFDGVVAGYTPSAPEVLLGLGGVALALAMVVFAVKVLPFLPESLGDAVVDPHAASSAAGEPAPSGARA
jgi:Ni/Fe-hydrogenase subunit HybB-like protein